MPIYYSLIGRGKTILCDAARQSGNFRLVAEKIMNKIPPYDAKMSYVHDNYIFHYSVSNNTIFLVLTDSQFDRRVAFSFLMDCQQLFQSRYGMDTEQISAYQFKDFVPELSKLMDQFSAQSNDRIARAKADVDILRGQVTENIGKVLERQEQIEVMVDRSESLAQSSIQFRKRSTELKKVMWWKNCKLWIVIIVVFLLIIFVIIVNLCGGFTFKKCRSDD